MKRSFSSDSEQIVELADWCRQASAPLEKPSDLDPLIERIGTARYVLMGEASHGTSEYYVWRSWLSRRLIEEKGFSFIAVEGEWPDSYCVNRYVKDYNDCGTSARGVLHSFARWPTWMWANWEVVALVEWMRRHNADKPDAAKVGFYGLDVYSLWESMEAVLKYVERDGSEAVEAAKRAYRCFEPYDEDAHQYARATDRFVPRTCEDEAGAMLAAIRREVPGVSPEERESHFVAEQNALVVRDAEAYYRTMMRGGPDSWNLRDTHMYDTLERLMRFHGPQAKGIVWEHNTHIGDARATDMADEDMLNVGQLVRENHPSGEVVLIGCGSYEGSVIAGKVWGSPMERVTVPPARQDSWEAVMRQAGPQNKLLLLDRANVPDAVLEPRGHRAIGVVYHADYERRGNYVPTVLPDRYDAFLYIDQTRALHPLHLEAQNGAEPPETYPWNV